ncbi:MAG: hypothetical protein IT369_23330 [Candidatus Latescibacteria bacterium]|nr:hypothetical protein [Candidatus Latescibacterota bacterium]
MKQSEFHVSFPILLATLGGIWVTSLPSMAGQGDGYFTIDGRSTEWGYLSTNNDTGDVKPTQVDGIDIWKLAYYYGQIFPTKAEYERNYRPPEVFTDDDGHKYQRFLPPLNWSIAIGYEVVGELFGGPVESSIEIFFDVYPDRGRGTSEVENLWHDFRPDYRFELRGKNGRIESEGYYAWEGDSWAGEQLVDTPEFAAAIGGSFFECLIPWVSFGSPITRDEEVPGKANVLLMAWAIRIRQGESSDYYPDPRYSQYRDLTGGEGIAYHDVFVELTAVEEHSWGRVKKENNEGNKGGRP